MKKFMKAVAFATVMCMLLSTVAFADAAVAEGNKLIVNVTEAGTEDMVALYIAEAGKGIGEAKPLYINQETANNGVASFEATISYDYESVDVYVGYAERAEDGACFIGNFELIKPVTEATVVKTPGTDVFVQGVKATEQTGAGVAATFEVVTPADVRATSMIWAIRYLEGEKEVVKYSDPVDTEEYELGGIVTGSVTLGYAFLNGSDHLKITPVTLTGVDAIFLFEGSVDGEAYEAEKATNNADMGNKLQ